LFAKPGEPGGDVLGRPEVDQANGNP